MIENNQLYQFDEASEINEPSPVETETGLASQPGVFRLLERVAVSFFCLLLLISIAKNPAQWAQWTKRQLHSAINATTSQTFGRVIKSPVINSIMANSRNLIRLEEVTNKLMFPHTGALTQTVLAQSLWPVSGKLTRGFGWYQPVGSSKPQFFKGIEIVGLPGAKVVAINQGKVVEVYQEAGSGWALTLDHGSGYRSVYRNLGQVSVNISQMVQSGERIANLKTDPVAGNLNFRLEIYEAGRPIDPLTVITPNYY